MCKKAKSQETVPPNEVTDLTAIGRLLHEKLREIINSTFGNYGSNFT